MLTCASDVNEVFAMGSLSLVALLLLSILVFVWLKGRHGEKIAGGVMEKNTEYDHSASSVSAAFGVPFLRRIGYFAASNDEKDTPNYVPTFLQDVDPKDYA